MFKKFLDIFRRSRQPLNVTQKNRIRFDSVISDPRFNFLDSIYKRILSNDTSLTDKEILDNYYKFSDKIQTNTFAAAELEWVIISVLCFYRPHLTNELIRRGLLSIVYSIGDNINVDDVLEFIQQRIIAPNLEPYGGLPPEPGMKWLTELSPTQKITIQQVLDEVIKQNRIELENL